MKNFKNWPGNYKFAFLCAIAAVIAGVLLLFWGGSGEDKAMAAVALAGGLLMAWLAPRWALDDKEERQARKRARQAREELRRSRRNRADS